MEKTFIIYFVQKLFQDVQSSLDLEIDGLTVSERTITRVHNHLLHPQGHQGPHPHDRVICPDEHKNHGLHYNSNDSTKDITHLLKTIRGSACVDILRNKGILIGGAEQILLHVKRVEEEVHAYFHNYL